MAETLSSTEPPEIEPIDLEILRSRLKELSEARVHNLDLSVPSDSNRKLLEKCANDFREKIEQLEADDANVAALGVQDLEAYLEKLKEEVCSVEDENIKISDEMDTLSRILEEDSIRLEGDLEALECTLKFVDSQGTDCLEADGPYWRSIQVDSCEDMLESYELMSTWNLKDRIKNLRQEEVKKEAILDLDGQIEKRKSSLNILKDLDDSIKRVEAVGQIADMLSAVKVIESDDSCIRLSLKTPVDAAARSCSSHNFNFPIETSVLEHELLIEVVGETMEPKNVEIFPGDICLNEIIRSVKFSRHMAIPITGSSLGWLVRQVQRRILVCTLRRLIVRATNKSRHSFEYSDRDETIIAHLVGGIDAFMKIPEGWPLASSALQLISIRAADFHSKSISLSFVCKVKDSANSLDLQTRCDLTSFVDAIEEMLIREMHSELHSGLNAS